MLKKYSQKNQELKHRIPSQIKVRPKYYVQTWLKYNIATHSFIEENQKYLLNHEWILENIPDIKNRYYLSKS